MKVLATDFIMIPVSDMVQSIPLYRDTLGLEIEANIEDQWVELKAPSKTLALYQTDKPRRRSTTGIVVGLAVEDVEATVEELRQANIPIVMEPQHGEWCWTAVITDPDGNQIGLHRRNDGTYG
mgnify:CR=1 FL=1